MDFINSTQLKPKDITDIQFDLLIAVAGKEERCNYFIRNFPLNSKRNIALHVTKNNLDFIRKSNEDFFSTRGFEPIVMENGLDRLFLIIDEIIEEGNRTKVKIFIDYSCMINSCYAGILSYLSEIEDTGTEIDVYFAYTPGKFIKSKKIRAVKKCKSLLPGHGQLSADKPTHIIVGLGLQPGFSDYILKELKSDSVSLFYSDPAPEGYVESIFETNRKIIDEVDIRNLHNYPLDDFTKTTELLTEICLDLRLKTNIIIIPVGPKVFTLSSLLVALRYPDIDVWRICTGNTKSYSRKEAASDPLVIKVTFSDLHD